MTPGSSASLKADEETKRSFEEKEKDDKLIILNIF